MIKDLFAQLIIRTADFIYLVLALWRWFNEKVQEWEDEHHLFRTLYLMAYLAGLATLVLWIVRGIIQH